MSGVLRIDNLDYRSSIGDIRRILKDYGALPSDIHLGSHANGKPNGTAFAIFQSRKEADQGLRADGIICRDSRIVIRGSNPKEFDKMFPGKPMLSSQQKSSYNRDNHEDRLTGVVKVEHIDYSASPSDIRRFFKERDARPEDIHLVLQPSGNKHNGCAFLIFSIPSDAVNALKLDGATFRDKRLSVKASNPKEFDRFFPRVPMITKAKGNVRGGRGGGRGGRGVGISGRGSNNNTPTSRLNNSMDDRSLEHFNTTPRGRGHGGMRGGGRVGGPGRGGGRFESDQFFSGANDNSNTSRGRSRSPINRGRRDSPVRNFNNGDSFDRRRPEPMRDSQRFQDPMPGINERKFLRVVGFPYDSSQVDIQNFFRPVLTREIYMERNLSGKYAGKFNGCAIAEFFSEGDARQAAKMDGRKFGHHAMSVSRAGKDEILRTIEENKNTNDSGPITAVPDFSALNSVAQSNPQVQHLLNLLTATVNTIAGAAAAASQPKPEKFRENRGERSDRSRDDPVINRVASSANIDVSDIKLGRVVGVRNLPYTVTPDEILHFFRNYKVIPDSVRIHYLEDGRCSGDAIICFRGNRDARNAVSDLNKGIIGRRKVELFFL